MPCYHPVTAWRCASGVFFKPTPDSSQIQLSCGRCIGCRLERSRQWAMRLTHELRFHKESSFITLTYKPECLPEHGSLNIKHFQDFMKRFRKDVYPKKIRFFHAGEYGEKLGRPHYHAIIFGENFEEGKYETKRSDHGDVTWCSPSLDRLWPFGTSRVGSVTFESCAYVARYITKKITGPSARTAYDKINYQTGEVHELQPEYATMSRRPGIGRLHFDNYNDSIYPNDYCVSVTAKGSFRSKPPKFYDKILEKQNPLLYQQTKEKREYALATSSKQDKTPERLAVGEQVKLAKIGQLKRRYEIG